MCAMRPCAKMPPDSHGASPRGLAGRRNATLEMPHLLKLEGLKRTVKSFYRKLSQATSALLG